jgi:hypothetical protein
MVVDKWCERVAVTPRDEVRTASALTSSIRLRGLTSRTRVHSVAETNLAEQLRRDEHFRCGPERQTF